MPDDPIVKGIRRVRPEDKAPVMALLHATGFFRPGELVIAEEVFDDALAKGPQGDYQSFVATEGAQTIGWLCFGQTPCTLGTFDIYWVAVDPKYQGRGIGKALMNFAHNCIQNRQGRLIVVETSGNPRYISTRRFYESLGYIQEACLKDFYAVDDDKIIYLYRLE